MDIEGAWVSQSLDPSYVIMKSAMKVPYASVNFRSEATLQDVASLLSSRLFGGIPFVELEADFWFNVPGLRLKESVLGCDVEMGGFSGNRGFMLRILSDGSGLDEMSDQELDLYRQELQKKILREHGHDHVQYDESVTDRYESVDLGEYVLMLLRRIEGIEMMGRCNW